ncbi:hypothetical protein [Acidiphilium sp.]|uniref:hypothetical protein n=1 Tax=Acidiphilium sp. TaxID=527 RepID=UPI003CFFEA6C
MELRTFTYQIAGLAMIFGLSGCETPKVVSVNQPSDNTLNCAQLNDQYTIARTYYKKAEGDRSVTGTNVAAAVLFWPALLGTYENTKDAIHAAKKRETKMIKLANQKSCAWSKNLMVSP